MSFQVLVIGGGIGGLCLAQGLRRAGVNVVVHERDRSRTDRLQGYRIHINPAGTAALRDCLPPELFQAFLATTGKAGDGFSFLTEQLRPLLRVTAADLAGHTRDDPVRHHHSVSRITLRQVLLAGLDVNFGQEFVRYRQHPDGKVTAFFADGTHATGDVLVGADGGRSRVRRQYLPHAEVIDTGIAGIAGKLPLTDATWPLAPPVLRSGAAFVTGAPGGRAMFLAVQEFDRDRAPVTIGGGQIGGSDPDATAGLLFDNTADYLMWGFTARRDRYPTELGGLDHEALRQAALSMISDWHPDLRRLVAASDPATVALLPIRTATEVRPWPTTPVTLLGDAIHSMTPYRGIGANIALRDARLLSRNLVAAHRGERALLAAIGDYEAQMRRYGFAAVRDSLRVAERASSDGRLVRTAGRAVLRAVGAVPPLRRRLFAAD